MTALFAIVIGTPLGAVGATLLSACAGVFVASVGAMAFDGMRPKGRHHRT